MQMNKEKSRDRNTGKEKTSKFQQYQYIFVFTRGHNTTSHRLSINDCPYFHFYPFVLSGCIIHVLRDGLFHDSSDSVFCYESQLRSFKPDSLHTSFYPNSNTDKYTSSSSLLLSIQTSSKNSSHCYSNRVMTQSAYTCSSDFMSFVFL